MGSWAHWVPCKRGAASVGAGEQGSRARPGHTRRCSWNRWQHRCSRSRCRAASRDRRTTPFPIPTSCWEERKWNQTLWACVEGEFGNKEVLAEVGVLEPRSGLAVWEGSIVLRKWASLNGLENPKAAVPQKFWGLPASGAPPPRVGWPRLSHQTGKLPENRASASAACPPLHPRARPRRWQVPQEGSVYQS